MGWLANLFGSSNGSTRKGQALSSTHDAFSLPTSSPGFNSHPDAFNPDGLQTPDPDSAMSPSYTYPPRGPSPYGYVPTSAGLSSRPTSASLLPTHMDSLHSPLSPHYPPLSKTWNRLRTWLNREYPELGDTLNYGMLPQDLAQLEMQFGFALPAVVRESYLCVDGQEAESKAGCSEGLFFGLTLLPLDDVLDEWRFWREVDEDPNTGANPRLRETMQSIPPGWVRREYSQRGWIPLIGDKTGNYIGVDLNPGEGGAVGQVIVFGRDFDTKVVLWKGDGPTGWAKWLAAFVEELESGEGFEIGPSEASEGSEDDLGYEGYYNDGRGQGDGGGDNGAGGGMHLTGEYRGWNVLEAWADRSVRKWHEAGVIPDTSLPSAEEDVKGKAVDKGPLVVAGLSQGTGAEIPIPILAESQEHIPPPTVPALNTQRSTASTSKALPTISVSKPPAPLPVELPTPRDIEAPSTPLESSSFDEDLEAGMREVSREEAGLVSSSTSRRAKAIARDISESSESAIPAPSSAVDVPLVAIAETLQTDPLSGIVAPAPIIPDLLADSTPALGTTPIEPSPSPKMEVPVMELPSLPSTSQETPEVKKEEEKSDPNTIRLVGGGGVSGTVTLEPETVPEVEAEAPAVNGPKDSDTQSLGSATSEASPKKGDKEHKKTKSGISLKKLGLGRKRDSVSSVKSVKSVKEVASSVAS